MAGNFSANASPTFSPVCFETEDAAQKHFNSYNRDRNVNPNAVSDEKVKRADALIENEEVELSDLIDILGPSRLKSDENAPIPIHEWHVGFFTPAMAGAVPYNTQSGYCVDTRPHHY